MSKELTIVDPKEFGLEEAKVKTIESAFTPKLIERDAFAEQYSVIIASELNAETFKAARELRLKLVKVRTGIDAIHKTEKAFYLASGKYVDALKNKLNLPIEQMEAKLKEIEEYEARIEAERKAKIKAERLSQLEPFGTDTEFVSVEEMTEEQFQAFLAKEKLAHETKLEQERKAEQERIEAEKKAEAERLEKERLEAEERKRIAEENARLKAKEELRNKRFIEMQPIAIVIRDFNGMIDLPEEEYQKQLEENRIGYSQHIQYQKEQSRKQEEEAEIARKKAETQARLAAKEKERADKLAAEIKAKEEAEKLAQEQERKRIEDEAAEKEAAEKAKRLAPDKEKINALFLAIKNFEFPECESEEAKQIIKDVKTVFGVALNNIKAAAATLK